MIKFQVASLQLDYKRDSSICFSCEFYDNFGTPFSQKTCEQLVLESSVFLGEVLVFDISDLKNSSPHYANCIFRYCLITERVTDYVGTRVVPSITKNVKKNK